MAAARGRAGLATAVGEMKGRVQRVAPAAGAKVREARRIRAQAIPDQRRRRLPGATYTFD
jgi:hypothetical protein